jgi:predicted HAD superfamily Cof-like phosphohydrolase
MRTNFQDVGDFHEKFGLPVAAETAPCVPDRSTLSFRIGFMAEELAEFCEAVGYYTASDELKVVIAGLRAGRLRQSVTSCPDLCQALDALIDLNYVSCGTAHFMGLPFDEGWAEVQRANMSKERATSAKDPRSVRGSALDVIKPEGFVPPNHEPAITACIRRGGSR